MTILRWKEGPSGAQGPVRMGESLLRVRGKDG